MYATAIIYIYTYYVSEIVPSATNLFHFWHIICSHPTYLLIWGLSDIFRGIANTLLFISFVVTTLFCDYGLLDLGSVAWHESRPSIFSFSFPFFLLSLLCGGPDCQSFRAQMRIWEFDLPTCAHAYAIFCQVIYMVLLCLISTVHLSCRGWYDVMNVEWFVEIRCLAIRSLGHTWSRWTKHGKILWTSLSQTSPLSNFNSHKI